MEPKSGSLEETTPKFSAVLSETYLRNERSKRSENSSSSSCQQFGNDGISPPRKYGPSYSRRVDAKRILRYSFRRNGMMMPSTTSSTFLLLAHNQIRRKRSFSDCMRVGDNSIQGNMLSADVIVNDSPRGIEIGTENPHRVVVEDTGSPVNGEGNNEEVKPTSLQYETAEDDENAVSNDPRDSDAENSQNIRNAITTQDCACSELPPDLSRCLECRQAERDNESAYCRFRDFRRLTSEQQSGGGGSIRAFGFVSHRRDPLRSNDASDVLEWLPPAENGLISRSSCGDHDESTAKFTLAHIAGYFSQLLDRERRLLNVVNSRRVEIEDSAFDNTDLPWKDCTGVRELCDVCSTTVFNLHVFCQFCGLCVCSDCFYDRLAGRAREAAARSQDKYGWTFCTRLGSDPFDNVLHDPSDMILAHLIPRSGRDILSTLEELDRRMQCLVQGVKNLVTLPVAASSPISSSADKESSHWFMFSGQILVLRQCRSPANLRLFQGHWKSSFPLIVENVHKELSLSLWEPSLFAELCRDHSSDMCIVDCRSGQVQRKISVQQFWEGFTNCGLRLRDKEKRKMYLKLKDWPPGDKFASVLREHYADFCKALPIPEYTHPEHGRFNLATKLPSFCLAPDLGPKMYTAYDMIFESEKGTTNLHLDVSDAVNVLVNVTTPSTINKDYLYKAIIDYLEEQELDEKDLKRAKRNPHRIGALWTIFKPQDNGLIREFLRELSRVRRGDVSDPIHDQKVYLNHSLRLHLQEDYGVKGFTFVQMLGDAVFIPAGAAHQVQNLLCCIKVAEDFVSPEGIYRCAVVADEFRSLTRDHTNHEDKLQLPNIVTHAVKESIGVLSRHRRPTPADAF